MLVTTQYAGQKNGKCLLLEKSKAFYKKTMIM